MPESKESAVPSQAGEPPTNTGAANSLEQANYFFDQVLELSGDWSSVDEVKAKLIVVRANDAIESFGRSEPEKRVQLKEIIEKAEQIIPPDSIDTLKKRAEKFILKILYPKRRRLRNALIGTIGVLIFLSLGGSVFLAVRPFLPQKQLTQEEVDQKKYYKALAEGLFVTHPDRALGYYREAHKIDPSDTEIAEKIKQLEAQLQSGGSK